MNSRTKTDRNNLYFERNELYAKNHFKAFVYGDGACSSAFNNARGNGSKGYLYTKIAEGYGASFR